MALRFIHKAFDNQTNKPMHANGISIWHLRGNQIAAGWVVTDVPVDC